MGMIQIDVRGSFGYRQPKQFSAMKSGHADAVAQAIEWLSSELLPEAIRLDHKLAAEGAKPEYDFAQREPVEKVKV